MTRSRWLQISTTVIRWVSFILMLCLAIDRAVVVRQGYTMVSLGATRAWNPALHPLIFSTGNTSEPIPNPPIIRPEGIPNLFGVCVYVFMCHHSVPGTVTPIRNKQHLMLRLFVPLFFSVFAFNVLLSGTAVAAFNEIKDLYTLNFVPDEHAGKTFHIPFILAEIFGYFLSLFPVFALSSTFPILGCTLLGNLATLCNMSTRCHTPRARRVLRYTLPFIVLLPPIIIGLLTDDIGFLVGFTGAFAGSGIQYVIPAFLVYRARCYMTRMMNETPVHHIKHSDLEDTQRLCLPDERQVHSLTLRFRMSRLFFVLWNTPWEKVESLHASPFQHVLWIVGLVVWSLLCIVIVLVDKIHPL
ncbi:Transmembrane protein [Fasciolopsis buskii]|uniref:Transmembrane protein n=1 Tax=Fasciolopsis buskii TaxID=27845 RepID=A0A8E0VEU7_9TREM|nr:Transmembrane protein [Fasciolopsis buski]